MAEELRSWLKLIVQAVEPWVSSQDIRTGSRRLAELSKELDETSFGLLCVTPEALQSQWLNFEAGALGKGIKDSKAGVVGILFGVSHGSVTGPISQFQNVEFGKDQMVKVLKDMNSRLSPPLDVALISKLFEKFWDDLDSAYKRHLHASQSNTASPSPRTDRDLLEELLARVKHQEEVIVGLREASIASDPMWQFGIDQKVMRILRLIREAQSVRDLTMAPEFAGDGVSFGEDDVVELLSSQGLPKEKAIELAVLWREKMSELKAKSLAAPKITHM